ncbi:sensor histidine kinase [Duganella sp. Root1480D1]|uniref:sensor histidine kinase n=1 Tax=Duganella sp. Root1480D1 TaxID=1736471 RepID=UPI0009EC723A|nr:histidine kinase [Duganella sp. Root1480D1]
MKHTPAPYGPGPALRRISSPSLRDWATSAVCGGLVLAICLWSGSWARAALFGSLVLGVICAQLAAGAIRRLMPRHAGWAFCWAGLALALLASACVATLAYGQAAQLQRMAALTSAQMFSSALVFNALMLGIPLLMANREARALQLSELQRAAVQAELKSLQAQVEPHFLYNTLANTRYLARHAPERAVEMLDHLIAYLRTALPDMRTSSSTLARECELAGHYLALMEIRFGARLSTRIDCPQGLGELQVPPMMLMSLVENALQHGVEPKPGTVCVSVAAAMRGDGRLGIVVRDDGAGLQQSQGATLLGSGVGLRNVRERLQALYGGQATFELRRAADGATEAELLLPMEARA